MQVLSVVCEEQFCENAVRVASIAQTPMICESMLNNTITKLASSAAVALAHTRPHTELAASKTLERSLSLGRRARSRSRDEN